MSATEAPPRRLEFVCPTCLASRYGYDDGPWPRCQRCGGIRMTPDSDEPPRVASNHRVIRKGQE
jgi:hypothetical protein